MKPKHVIFIVGLSLMMNACIGKGQGKSLSELADSINKNIFLDVWEKPGVLFEYSKGVPQTALLPRFEFSNPAIEDSIRAVIMPFLAKNKYTLDNCYLTNNISWNQAENSFIFSIDLDEKPLQSIESTLFGGRFLGYTEWGKNIVLVTGVPDFDGYSVCQDDTICVPSNCYTIKHDIVLHRIEITDPDVKELFDEVRQDADKRIKPNLSYLFVATVDWDNKPESESASQYVVSLEGWDKTDVPPCALSMYALKNVIGYTLMDGYTILVAGAQQCPYLSYRSNHKRKKIPIRFVDKKDTDVKKDIPAFDGWYNWLFKVSENKISLLTNKW